MRKFTLLLIALSFAVFGVAQNLQITEDAPLKQEQISPFKDLKTFKAGGDIF